VPLRRGEGILVSEGLRTREDKAAFLAANAAGRRGVGFASLMREGFAGGGINDSAGVKTSGSAKKKSPAGEALDAITNAAAWVAKAITDPAGALTSLFDNTIGRIPCAGDMLALAKGFGKHTLDAIIEKAKSVVAP